MYRNELIVFLQLFNLIYTKASTLSTSIALSPLSELTTENLTISLLSKGGVSISVSWQKILFSNSSL
jgi:hypothetical protein